jgi:predicted nucleotide-binding protein
MARKTTPVARPERPFKTADEKQQDILRLQRRIADVEAFDPSTITKRFSNPQVTALQTSIDSTLSAVFGHQTAEYNRYSGAVRLDNGGVSMGRSESPAEEAAKARRYLGEGKDRASALLRQAVLALEEEIEFAAPAMPVVDGSVTTPAAKLSRRVFIVHGHDDGAKEGVARYLAKIGFDPVILHEQANKGMTVIEKIEANSDVGFAVVLLTPDDEGGKLGEAVAPRARQNVLLELGYFIGRLGRPNVCALRKGALDIPSDFAGAIYEELDAAGAWRSGLARELQAAGHEIDWNVVMKP